MGYPRRLLTSGEKVVREFRPHWRLLAFPFLAGLASIVLIVVTWTLAPDNSIFDWFVTAVAAICLVWYGLWRFIKWWFTLYVLTTERLITRSGVVARRGLEIPLENINDIKFSQNIVERLLKSGDLLIESAGEQGQSRFSDIPQPEEFQSLLYRVREERSNEMSTTASLDPTSQLERLAALHRDGIVSDEEYEEKRKNLLDRM